MDTISFNPIQQTPIQTSSGGKSTLYIVVFFLCVISVMAGSFYFMLGSKDADISSKLKELQARTQADLEAAKSEEAKREIKLKADIEAQKATLKANEEMLKKAQARVDIELADAAKRVRDAKELQRQAQNIVADAAIKEKEAAEAMKKANETNDANAKKLADEKKKLSDEAAKQVAEAEKKAKDAIAEAKIVATKVTDLQTRLNQAEAKMLGKNFARAAPYNAVPGYYTSGAVWSGDHFNISDPNWCRNYARANGFASWGHRNASHPDPKYRNSCFIYKTSGKYEGNGTDDIHMVGCAFDDSNPKTGCRTPVYGFTNWNYQPQTDYSHHDIWYQEVRGDGAKNRESSLERCKNDNGCVGLICSQNGTRCWGKSALQNRRGNNDRFTWIKVKGWK